MKALILNSGLGSRMGELTKTHPKCMTEIAPGETIVSRQLRLLAEAGIKEIVMTTGVFAEVLQEYCDGLGLPVSITYVLNPKCRETNYIYSMECAREHLDDDLLLMHGDLVFELSVLTDLLASPVSCMAVSSALPLPEKDFKAVVLDGQIRKVGIEFFDHAVAAQPLYRLRREDWRKWQEKITAFCENGNTKVYAENALNELDGAANLFPLDVGERLCGEIDNPEDLEKVKEALRGKVDRENRPSGQVLEEPSPRSTFVYCLFCRTQRCTRIAQLLQIRGVDRAFSPKVLSRQRVKGENLTKERDLLPGYVFLFHDERIINYELFSGIDGIIRRVGRTETGYELEGPDREFALGLLEKGGKVGAMKMLKVGETIRLEDPLFAGSEGVVTKIDYRKERARVDFKFEGNDCHAWIAVEEIRKTMPE